MPCRSFAISLMLIGQTWSSPRQAALNLPCHPLTFHPLFLVFLCNQSKYTSRITCPGQRLRRENGIMLLPDECLLQSQSDSYFPSPPIASHRVAGSKGLCRWSLPLRTCAVYNISGAPVLPSPRCRLSSSNHRKLIDEVRGPRRAVSRSSTSILTLESTHRVTGESETGILFGNSSK